MIRGNLENSPLLFYFIRGEPVEKHLIWKVNIIMNNILESMKPICDKCNIEVDEFLKSVNFATREYCFLAKCHGEEDLVCVPTETMSFILCNEIIDFRCFVQKEIDPARALPRPE